MEFKKRASFPLGIYLLSFMIAAKPNARLLGIMKQRQRRAHHTSHMVCVVLAGSRSVVLVVLAGCRTTRGAGAPPPLWELLESCL